MEIMFPMFFERQIVPHANVGQESSVSLSSLSNVLIPYRSCSKQSFNLSNTAPANLFPHPLREPFYPCRNAEICSSVPLIIITFILTLPQEN